MTVISNIHQTFFRATDLKKMFKESEVKFERLKKQLEALDYNEVLIFYVYIPKPLGIESFNLVQHLFNDLYMTTTSLQSLSIFLGS